MRTKAFMMVLLSVFLPCAITPFAMCAGDLIVADGRDRTLQAGKYEYETVKLGKNAKLLLNGSVTIACKKFESAEGARIEYVSSLQRAGQTKEIKLYTLDASGLLHLTIKGNGASAPHRQGEAAQGASGRNASPATPWFSGRSAHRGGQGTAGTKGENGEHAANITIHLPHIKPGSVVSVESKGGNGGNGQKGGKGGSGGRGALFHPAADGGKGGTGGGGGNAGNGGSVYVYLVCDDGVTLAEMEDVRKSVTINLTGAGAPGERGTGGLGGSGGDGGRAGGGTAGGSRGSIGDPGGHGTTGTTREARIDIKLVSAYAREYQQILQELRSPR